MMMMMKMKMTILSDLTKSVRATALQNRFTLLLILTKIIKTTNQVKGYLNILIKLSKLIALKELEFRRLILLFSQ